MNNDDPSQQQDGTPGSRKRRTNMITSTCNPQTRTSLPCVRLLSRSLALAAVFAAALALPPNCFSQSSNQRYGPGYTNPSSIALITGCCRYSQPSPSITVIPQSSPSIPAPAVVFVGGYVRQNGTYVQPYVRTAPDGIRENNWSTWGNVNPYTGKVGTRR
jgi:hypothetical protein